MPRKYWRVLACNHPREDYNKPCGLPNSEHKQWKQSTDEWTAREFASVSNDDWWWDGIVFWVIDPC